MSDLSSMQRRKILAGLMKLLIFIGLIFISIPFFSSFSSNAIDEKQKAASPWLITLAVTELVQGKVKALDWAGRPVWVYARTENDIQLLDKGISALRDSVSAKSDQPAQMKNKFRSADKHYFVFIPNENKRSCQVRLNTGETRERFIEPCYGARFDAAGRIFENSGHKDKTQQNLPVPEHVVEDGVLKIALWMPKV